MDPEKLARADLAKLIAGMPGLIAATLTALFDAEVAEAKHKDQPRVALRSALAQFRKDHERKGDVWAKRETPAMDPVKGIRLWNYSVLAGDIDGDGDDDYACKTCMQIQPEMACRTCAMPGPGNCCVFCGTYLCGGCPGCGASWYPIQASEDTEGARVRRVCAVVQEARASAGEKNVGVIRSVINSEVKDDWGTIINPKAIANRVKPGKTRIDIDHQVCKHKSGRRGCQEHDGLIDGAECSSVTEAKVPWKKKDGTTEVVDAVIVETRCDLTKPRAKMLYEGVRTGKWTECSILFTYPKEVDEAIKAGRTDRIDDVHEVPAYTFSAHASNPVAVVTEVRTARLIDVKVEDAQQVIATGKREGEQTAPAGEQKPASGEQPAPEGDQLADLKQAVASIDGESSPPAPATPVEPAATAEQQPAGGAPELSLESVNTKLDNLASTVEQIRTAAPSWKPGLDAAQTRAEEIAAQHQQLTATVEGQRTQIEQLKALNADLVKLITNGITRVNARIAKLTVPPAREGHSGAESEVIDSRATSLAKTREQRERDAMLDEAERIGSLSARI